MDGRCPFLLGVMASQCVEAHQVAQQCAEHLSSLQAHGIAAGFKPWQGCQPSVWIVLMLLAVEGCKELLGPLLVIPLSIFFVLKNQGMHPLPSGSSSDPVLRRRQELGEGRADLVVPLPCCSLDLWEPGCLPPKHEF